MSGRILIVDDVATNRMVLAAKLTAAYYEVHTADSGAEALILARKNSPDLILLDVLMPGLDGFETCRRIKDDPVLADIPVIMISTLHSPPDRRRAWQAGADDFFSRPENDRVLLARLRNLLRAKRVMDDLSLRGQALDDLGLSAPLFEIQKEINARPGLAVAGEMSALSDVLPGLAPFHDIAPLAITSRPDLILMALDQGPQGSFQQIASLRADIATRHLPILLLMPGEDTEILTEALDIGANDVLVLPRQAKELALRINHWIARKFREDMLRDRLHSSLCEAVLDPLTGLHNRRYFERHFARAMGRADLSGKGFALLMIDIDNFKQVNDRFGHGTGDAILKELANRLVANLRGVDLIARIGGEEFLVAMPATSRAEAMPAAERLRHLIADKPFEVSATKAPISITASIGLVCDQDLHLPLKQLTDAADQAMYRSKNDGRNMVTLINCAA